MFIAKEIAALGQIKLEERNLFLNGYHDGPTSHPPLKLLSDIMTEPVLHCTYSVIPNPIF